MREQLLQLIVQSVWEGYPGYPPRLKRSTNEEIQAWQKAGKPHDRLLQLTTPVFDHPAYLGGLKSGQAWAQDSEPKLKPSLTGEAYETDSAGWPLHPFYAPLLRAGAVSGPGGYWRLGPNIAADTVLLRLRQETVEALLIKRGDNGKWALPGGMQDEGEDLKETATRELMEETGVDLKALGLKPEVVYRGLGADPRTTINAWPETQAIFAEVSADLDFEIKAGDDAKDAAWKQVWPNMPELHGSHSLIIKAALKRLGS